MQPLSKCSSPLQTYSILDLSMLQDWRTEPFFLHCSWVQIPAPRSQHPSRTHTFLPPTDNMLSLELCPWGFQWEGMIRPIANKSKTNLHSIFGLCFFLCLVFVFGDTLPSHPWERWAQTKTLDPSDTIEICRELGWLQNHGQPLSGQWAKPKKT